MPIERDGIKKILVGHNGEMIKDIGISARKDIEDLFKEYLELRIKQKYVLSETVVTRLINKLNEYGKTDKAALWKCA